MKNLFAKCGMNCGRCSTYKENLKTEGDRQRCSDAWKKYFNIRLSPEKLRLCDGCQTPDHENPVRYINCRARKCAIFNSVETCAHCSAYPCEDVAQYSLTTDAIQKMSDRLGSPIPQKDYIAFIEPYEAMKHLDAIRSSLASEKIVEMKPVSFKPKIIDFPENLPLGEEESYGFKPLHRLLSQVGTANNISYARQLALKKTRQHILKILWGFGCFGQYSEQDDASMVLDSEAYLDQKIHSYHSRVCEYFKILKKYGVLCEIIPLIEKEWLTPTGALRKDGWLMKMSFGKKAGGSMALKSLVTYTAKLQEKYGKNAFRTFSKADMRDLYE